MSRPETKPELETGQQTLSFQKAIRLPEKPQEYSEESGIEIIDTDSTVSTSSSTSFARFYVHKLHIFKSGKVPNFF